MDCQHLKFESMVTVIRIQNLGKFQANIVIRCADCGQPFEFVGLPRGMNIEGPAVSLDGLEARLAVRPIESRPIIFKEDPSKARMLN